jgi:2-polyprenyl-3-methyl-5-hydroxy-6-metoxy-1,4-benzoquinol methylase
MFYKDGLLSQSSLSHSPHNLIPQLISPKSTILDVGCNTGILAQSLKSKKVTIDGIDINEEALKIARPYYRKLYKRDLYNPTLDLPHMKYDYIVFSDLLEHLPRPDLLLKDTKQYLKPDGVVIASIPNIARLEIRLKLMLGKFDYKPGIMSPDHLRFFTRRSALEMFQDSGYQIINVVPTGLGHILKLFPTLTAFQFIYTAKSASK